MSATATATQTLLPVGAWKLDPTHSSASFAVKHMVVATFRGRFENIDATLSVGEDGAGQTARHGRRQLDRRQGREPPGPPRLARLLRHRALPRAALRLQGDPPRRRGARRRRRADDQGPHARCRGTRHDHRPARDARRRRQDRRHARDRDRPHAVRPGVERAAAEGRLRARQRRQADRRARARAGRRVARPCGSLA